MRSLACTLLSVLVLAGASPAAEGRTEEAASAAFERARVESREHLRSEDFALARAALLRVIEDYPGTDAARRAAAEISYVDKRAGRALADAFKDAARAAKSRRWSEALAGFSRLAARTDAGDWAAKARAEIKKISDAAEAEYAARAKEASALVKGFAFGRAGDRMRSLARTLQGTGAGERAAADARDLADLAGCFTDLVQRINDSSSAPQKTPFKVSDMTGWEARRPITRADDEKIWIDLGGVLVTRPWKGFSPDQFTAIMELYNPASEDRLALAVRWLWEGDEARAQAALQPLVSDPVAGVRARQLLNRFRRLKNEIAYEFEDGAEILDWQGRSGRWAIAGGRLVQESLGEGRLELTNARVRADELRVACDVVLAKGTGSVTIELVQDERNAFGFSLSVEQGYLAYATVDGATQSVKDERWRPKPNQRYVLRCGVKGERTALSVGTLKMPRLEAKGVSKLEGRLVLRTAGAAVQFDRLRIANRRE